MTTSGKQVFVITVLAAMGFAGCARSPKLSAARFIESGNKQLEKKDYPRALLEFMNATKADPRNAEAYYRIAVTQLATGNNDAAVASLRKAIGLNPKHTAAQVKLAELMTTARTREVLEDAQNRLQEVLKSSPDSADALDALAMTEFRLGKPDLAEQHLNEALRKFPQNLKTSAALAGLKLRQGDKKAAEQVLKEAVASAPQSSEAHLALGEYYRTMLRASDAEAQFRAALKLDPKSGIAMIGISALQEQAGHPDQVAETLKSVSALPDKEYKPLYGLYLYQTGKKDAAIAEFEKLARRDPADRSARTRLISAYVGVGRSSDAEKMINEALRRNPKDGDALLQRSEICLRQGKLKQAEQDLTELSRQRPGSGEVHYLLARVKQAAGDTLQAKQELGTAVRLSPGALAPRIELARSLTGENAARAALSMMNEAPAPQHRLVPFIVERNWELSALGDNTALRKGIDEGLEVARSPDLLLQDALLKLNERNYTGAQASLIEASKNAPDDPRIVNALAEVYDKQKDAAKGVDVVRQYASRHTQSAAAQRLLGNWLLKSGDRNGARTAFESSKAADPTDAATDLVLAQLDIAEGKFDAAQNRLKSLIGVSSENLWVRASSLSAEILLANVEETTGNHREAMEHYRHVADLDPSNSVALNNLAYLLVDYAHQPDEAIKLAQKAKELDPDNPAVSDTIGWALYQKGIYRTAVEQLTPAASTGSPLMKYHLAMAYMKAGDNQRGQRMFQEALRLNPGLQEAKMTKDVLDQTTRSAK